VVSSAGRKEETKNEIGDHYHEAALAPGRIGSTMSPTMQMTAPSAMYTPSSDAIDRHDYGVSKNRKIASTGGGRAWSEDEVRGYSHPRAVASWGSSLRTTSVVLGSGPRSRPTACGWR
jgi:hypothetical protein